jgi:hypothetical protein
MSLQFLLDAVFKKKDIIRLLQKKTNSMRFIGSQLNSLLQFEEGINLAMQYFETERPTKYLQNLGDYLMIGIS